MDHRDGLTGFLGRDPFLKQFLILIVIMILILLIILLLLVGTSS